MLDLVPLAGAGRKVTDRDRQSGLNRQLLQLPFPQAQAVTVTASGVSGDEQIGGARVKPVPLLTPPASDGGYRETRRVVIGAHVDEATVLPQIVNA